MGFKNKNAAGKTFRVFVKAFFTRNTPMLLKKAQTAPKAAIKNGGQHFPSGIETNLTLKPLQHPLYHVNCLPPVFLRSASITHQTNQSAQISLLDIALLLQHSIQLHCPVAQNLPYRIRTHTMLYPSSYGTSCLRSRQHRKAQKRRRSAFCQHPLSGSLHDKQPAGNPAALKNWAALFHQLPIPNRHSDQDPSALAHDMEQAHSFSPL